MGKVRKEKRPDVRSHKPDGAKRRKLDRKSDDAPKYRFIYPQFVKGAADAMGISCISEDVNQGLAEDATYRLRTIIQLCAKYLKHSRHNRLRCEDVNAVLNMCDVPPIFGYGQCNFTAEFTAIREAGVFILDDHEINLAAFALHEMVVNKQPVLTVRGKWLAIEDQKRVIAADGKNDASDGAQLDPNQESDPKGRDIETGDYEPKIATVLIKYYANISNSVLGYTDLTIILKDLSRNDKILPVIPFMLNFITISLNNLGTERQINRLLQTINALTDNFKLDFRPLHPTLRIASVLLKIIKSSFLERKRDALLGLNWADRSGATYQFSHSIAVRVKAAQILAKVSRRWCCSEEQIILEMMKLITDLTLPARVHVGVITVLKELGPAALKTSLWDNLSSFFHHLETVTADKEALEFAILEAAMVLNRFPHLDSSECPPYSQLDRLLFSYFGDRLCPFWLVEPPIIPVKMLEPTCDQIQPILTRGNWQLPKCINSMYNPMAKRQSIQMAFELPIITKKRNPRIIFKFAGANPVPEINLKRKRLDPRYSQFIAGKVSEGHVVLIGKYWRPPPSGPKYSVYECASLYNFL